MTSKILGFLPRCAQICRIADVVEPLRWDTADLRVLDAQSAINAGGWDSRCTVSLAVATAGDVAAALIDTNGDGAAIDLDEYERDADGNWQGGSSGSAGDYGVSWSSKMVAIWGQVAPEEVVEIEYLGSRYPTVASDAGWWLFVAPSTDDSDSVPRRI